MKLSIVLPIHNEEENIVPLFEEIQEVLKELNTEAEIIHVDDGSTDRSVEIITDLASKHPEVKLVEFSRNFGQTAAMAAGIEFASGETIVLMDADRQNDPKDIPLLLNKIDEGYDVCVGWRKDRKDNTLNRKIPSLIANRLIRNVGGVQVHDLGCSLKAFRKELIKRVKLYGEMHRFIPLYTTAAGGRITEVVVNHRARVAGVTKYGINRTFKVILDLITVVFLMKYSTRPMYFFGGGGLVMLMVSGITSLFLILHKFMHDISIIQSPLLIVASVFFILSFNFILMGLLAEMQMRTYFESQDKPSFFVRSKVNF